MNTPLGPDLRAMLWKETKENGKWAILALIGLSLALVFTIAQQRGGLDSNSFAAVWGSAGLVMTFGAPVVGLAFGLLQVLPELRRDQWAFLVHRPAPRATLFWGKALAGIGLMLLATLVPLLGLAAWAAAPGHVPAPFDPRLLLGGLAAILTGLVFYTAGLLTALRPARWYGSRALPVAMAVVCALLVASAAEFLHALLWIALFLTALLPAARGSFLTTGHYARQPRPAKFGLGLTLYVGLAATLIAAAMLIGGIVTTLVPSPHRHDIWQTYEITRSGRVLRVTMMNGDAVSATDLSGHSVPLAASSPYDDTFLREQYLGDEQRTDQGRFNQPWRYAIPVGGSGVPTGGPTWYYVPARRQLLAYSLDNRRLIGTLGPDGFSPGDTGTSRFTGPLSASVVSDRTLLAFPHAVYLLDTAKSALRPFLATPRRIGNVSLLVTNSELDPSRSKMVYVVNEGDQFALFSSDGHPLSVLPRGYDRRVYPEISVAMTPDAQRFFIRYLPRWRGGETKHLPSYVTAVTADGTVIRTDVLPPISSPPVSQSPLLASLFGLLSPPMVTAGAAALGILGRHVADSFFYQFWVALHSFPRFWIGFCSASILGGLVSALLAWRIGRRCVFAPSGRAAWAMGVFWLGLPGVLLLLCLRDWPARESCPNCSRLRVVDRERCEHCGAAFAAPTRDGTEIFEKAEEALPRLAEARLPLP